VKSEIMKQTLEKITADPRYIKNIEYGEPRPGHPEGKVRYHLAELEANLEVLKPRLAHADDYWKLKFLIHVHDTFKAQAEQDVPILHPRGHASLAKAFAAEFTDDLDLLNMVQFHDENYALWKQFASRGTYDQARFDKLLNTIRDWDLFLAFLIIDGTTAGKDPAKLAWFIGEVRKHRRPRVDESWLLPAN
jgi:hypothetical protein